MCQPTWRRVVWERYIGDTFHGKCYTIRCASMLTPFQFDLGYDDRTPSVDDASTDVVKPTCTACASMSRKHGSFSQWNEWSQLQRVKIQSVPYIPGNMEIRWRSTYGDVLFAPCRKCMADCSVFTFVEYGTVTCDACRAATPQSSVGCNPLGFLLKRYAQLRAKIGPSP